MRPRGALSAAAVAPRQPVFEEVPLEEHSVDIGRRANPLQQPNPIEDTRSWAAPPPAAAAVTVRSYSVSPSLPEEAAPSAHERRPRVNPLMLLHPVRPTTEHRIDHQPDLPMDAERGARTVGAVARAVRAVAKRVTSTDASDLAHRSVGASARQAALALEDTLPNMGVFRSYDPHRDGPGSISSARDSTEDGAVVERRDVFAVPTRAIAKTAAVASEGSTVSSSFHPIHNSEEMDLHEKVASWLTCGSLYPGAKRIPGMDDGQSTLARTPPRPTTATATSEKASTSYRSIATPSPRSSGINGRVAEAAAEICRRRRCGLPLRPNEAFLGVRYPPIETDRLTQLLDAKAAAPTSPRRRAPLNTVDNNPAASDEVDVAERPGPPKHLMDLFGDAWRGESGRFVSYSTAAQRGPQRSGPAPIEYTRSPAKRPSDDPLTFAVFRPL